MRFELSKTACTWAAVSCLCVGAFGQSPGSYTVSGSVFGPNDAPQSGATVWLVREFSIDTEVADDAGNFLFEGVESSSVDIIAYAPSFALAGKRFTVLDDTHIRLDVESVEPTRIRAVTPQLDPLTGARVERLVIEDRFQVPLTRLAAHGLPAIRSGEDGVLPISYLSESGFARIEIAHREYATEILPTLPAGTRVDAVLPYGRHLRGRVVDSDGKGLAGSRIQVLPAHETIPHLAGRTETGPEGFYSVRVPPGSYRVLATHSEFADPTPVRVEVGEGADTVVDPIQMNTCARVSGTVLDSRGAPVSRLRVRFMRDGFVRSQALSDAQGRYALLCDVASGYLHYRPPPGYALLGPETAELELQGALPATIPPVTVARLGAIHGAVGLEGSVPTGPILVSTTNLEENIFVLAEEDGRFTLTPKEFPANGVVRLRAEHVLRFVAGESTYRVDNADGVNIALQPARPLTPTAGERLGSLRGVKAPELRCESWFNVLDAAEPSSVRALAGNVVVLFFWAGFDTGPRLREFTAVLSTLHGLYDDVAVVGIHEGTTDTEAIASAIDEFDIEFPVGKDSAAFETFEAYRTAHVPRVVLIDKRGALQFDAAPAEVLPCIKDLRRR